MSTTSSWNVINPATEAIYCTVQPTTGDELEAIVARMRAAQQVWRTTSLEERAAACRQFIDAFRAMKEAIALDLTRQMGKPLSQARREVDTTLDRADAMIRLAPSALQDDTLAPKDRFRRFIRHEPHGIVLDIPAWNYPLLIAVNVVIPGLLAGNAILLKHARLTPKCGDAFAEAFRKTSLPPDLIASIHVSHDVVGRLIDARAVDFVSSTGSVEGGRQVYQAASARLLDMG